MIDASFGHWLAGFIDGEGCFRIKRGVAGRRHPYYVPEFTLKQRDDDASLIASIIERTGIGHLDEDRQRTGNSNPCVRWTVHTMQDTPLLCALLDEYPLRSRKARDYAIWREAVIFKASQPRGNRWRGPRDMAPMEDFKRQIEGGRVYAGRG